MNCKLVHATRALLLLEYQLKTGILEQNENSKASDVQYFCCVNLSNDLALLIKTKDILQ